MRALGFQTLGPQEMGLSMNKSLSECQKGPFSPFIRDPRM